jgi:hypothetical protein
VSRWTSDDLAEQDSQLLRGTIFGLILEGVILVVLLALLLVGKGIVEALTT